MTSQTGSQEKKFTTTAYLLWGLGLFGICGLHRMYLGQYGTGVAMLMTFGLCGVGQIIDGFVIPEVTKETNAKNGIQLADQPVHALATSTKDLHQTGMNTGAAKFDDLDELAKEQASVEEALRKLKG